MQVKCLRGKLKLTKVKHRSIRTSVDSTNATHCYGFLISLAYQAMNNLQHGSSVIKCRH
jgi:hypothetical protein